MVYNHFFLKSLSEFLKPLWFCRDGFESLVLMCWDGKNEILCSQNHYNTLRHQAGRIMYDGNENGSWYYHNRLTGSFGVHCG